MKHCWSLLMIAAFGCATIVPVASAAMATKGKNTSMKDWLPSSINGWKAEGPAVTHDRTSIFDYMDGAGELYLAFDFRELWARRYKRDKEPSIVAEVYDMGVPQDAYGIFSDDPSGESAGIGQESRYAAGYVKAWKGNVFVRVIAERETSEARAAVLALGRSIMARVTATGAKPGLVTALPSAGQVADSLHFFHKQVCLNSHFYLADRNLLHLSDRTNAVACRYVVGREKVQVLVIEYPAPSDVRAAREDLWRLYLEKSETLPTGLILEPVEKGEFVGVKAADNDLILVFEAKDRDTAAKVIATISEALYDAREKGGGKG